MITLGAGARRQHSDKSQETAGSTDCHSACPGPLVCSKDRTYVHSIQLMHMYTAAERKTRAAGVVQWGRKMVFAYNSACVEPIKCDAHKCRSDSADCALAGNLQACVKIRE